MGNYTIFKWSKILGETGKQEILQQMFRKFQVSNRLPNRYFPKTDVGCPWLPVDQLFKLNKLGLLKKVIDGRTPEYLITTLDSLRFEHKYSTRTKTLCCLLKPRTEAMRRTFFYSTIKELNALNLEPTTSFRLVKTTLTKNIASDYTVDNFKVKKLSWF